MIQRAPPRRAPASPKPSSETPVAHDPYQILANPFSLEGYAVIITGAGGSIGGAAAHVLAQSGANVVVSDLSLIEPRER